ncbi:MAG: aldolase [Bacteroidetes bacterium HGW-Bacteroidetes-21]|jgi:L-fuculose-phosphate aldolase|nr:MAG: aldolase [Bacteroidetes bacterium HGW-Bacteroidetes-21]
MTKAIQAKADVAAYMQRLYNKGLTTCSGGNISIRLSKNQIAITPSGVDKSFLTSDDIIICDMSGKAIKAKHKASMETAMHLAIYKARPDVHAVVHAHPPYATAFSTTNHEINTALTGETRALLGKPETATYACMGSSKLAESAGKASLKTNTILLSNHGAITLGTNIFEAYNRMEVLEAAAHVCYISKMLGKEKPLSSKQTKDIDTFFKSYSKKTAK